MEDQMHYLNCSICGHPYWSKNQFPEEKVCEQCMGSMINYDSNGVASTGGQQDQGPLSALSKKRADPEQWKKDKKARKKARKARKKNRKR